MIYHWCDRCRSVTWFKWIRDRETADGRRWEDYACENCDHEIEIESD